MEYQIIRSDRKTMALQIKDGALIVRAPKQAKKADMPRIISSLAAGSSFVLGIIRRVL